VARLELVLCATTSEDAYILRLESPHVTGHQSLVPSLFRTTRDRSCLMRPQFAIALGALALMLAGCATVPSQNCDRSCLLGTVDQYVAAVVAHEPARVTRAAGFRETQNAVDAAPGTGIWSTALRLGEAVRYADAEAGEVGFFGVIEEQAGPALAGLRLRVSGGAVSEAEWIIARKGMALYKPEGFRAALPRTTRRPGTAAIDRTAAIRIANSYFEGIDESSAPLVMEHPECFRIENGTHMVGRRPSQAPLTADRPAGDGLTGPTSRGINHCTEGFDTVGVRTADVIDRRFFHDREAGVVWSHGTFSRQPGAMQRNEPLKWLNFFELFEIEDGRIRGIYAVMDYLPAEITGSGWGGADE
jgi:hypothetical protein